MKNAKMQLVRKEVKGRYAARMGHFVRWQREDGTIREPEEAERKFSYPGIFPAGGRRYLSWQQLCAVKTGKPDVYRDIYGRKVLALRELFPCFDSYDYMYENRYFRWFYLKEDGKLVCVYYEDQWNQIKVTEDVCSLREQHWNALKEAGFGSEPEEMEAEK